MAKVIKVVANGLNIPVTGEAEVHVEDDHVVRVLTFGDTAREQVLCGGEEVDDYYLPYGDLFGNDTGLYDDPDDEEEECCPECYESIYECTCDDEDDDDLFDDEDDDLNDEDDQAEYDDEVAIQAGEDILDDDNPSESNRSI